MADIQRIKKFCGNHSEEWGDTETAWVWRGLPGKWGTEAEGHAVSLRVCSHAHPGQPAPSCPLHLLLLPTRPQVPGPPPSPSTSLPRGAVRLFHSFVFQTLRLLFYVEQKFRLLTSCFISLYLCMTICAFYGLPKKSCSAPKSKTQLPRFS